MSPTYPGLQVHSPVHGSHTDELTLHGHFCLQVSPYQPAGHTITSNMNSGELNSSRYFKSWCSKEIISDFPFLHC